jgi:hypothetical protein
MTDWPPKSSFEPPRYPNAWLYVSTTLAPTYNEAIALVLASLRQYVGFDDSLSPRTNSECADGQQRVHHLQPVAGLPNPARDHYHDLHIRYYFGHLRARQQHRVAVESDGRRLDCWRLPASVHYEPEPENPFHPYIDECPVCGVVSPYDLPGDRCEMSHDPLGLELLFYGTIRGDAIMRANGEPVGGLTNMTTDYDVRLSIREPEASDMNTLRLGVAVILPISRER